MPYSPYMHMCIECKGPTYHMLFSHVPELQHFWNFTAFSKENDLYKTRQNHSSIHIYVFPRFSSTAMGHRSSTQKYHHCHWKEWNLRVQSDGQAPSRSVVVQKWTTATVFRVRSLCCPSWYRPDLSSVHNFLSGEDRDPPTLPYCWRSIAEICAVSWIGWSFRGKNSYRETTNQTKHKSLLCTFE